MNSKLSKRIRKHSRNILCSWMHTLISEEEREKITPENVGQYLAQQEYIFNNKTLYLSIYTERWTIKILKKMIAQGFKLENITFDMFNKNYRNYIGGTN